MTDKPEPNRNRPETGADGRPTPSIPDGGLGSVMPDWMQRAPAWKRASTTANERALPAPDTSVIDPRLLIGLEDLPEWLQAVARREPAPFQPTPRPGSAPPSPPIAPARAVPATPSRSFVDIGNRPAEASVPPDPAHPPTVSGKPAWWMSDRAIVVLFGAIVLTILYVVLVASGIV